MEAKRTCSAQEMIQLQGGGFSAEQIRGMCTTYAMNESGTKTLIDAVTTVGKTAMEAVNANSSNGSNYTATAAPAWPANQRSGGMICTTQAGSCPLMQPLQPGTPCQCSNGWVRYSGMVR
jgi:hypothetical protein